MHGRLVKSGWLDELKLLYRLLAAPIGGGSHAERLERFYGPQAEAYDAFRPRLLHGRRRLVERLPLAPGARWLDLGAGTGAALDTAGPRVAALEAVYLVDLSPSLLRIARGRIAAQPWRHVHAVEADVTHYEPPGGPVDVVTFSYALTMIPDWFAAIEQALRVLKPGGCLGVVDFYVSRKHPAPGLRRHGWSTRVGWPAFFALDNVFPSPEHLPYLRHRLESVHLEECRGSVPYLPLLRAPYYLYLGRKRANSGGAGGSAGLTAPPAGPPGGC